MWKGGVDGGKEGRRDNGFMEYNDYEDVVL